MIETHVHCGAGGRDFHLSIYRQLIKRTCDSVIASKSLQGKIKNMESGGRLRIVKVPKALPGLKNARKKQHRRRKKKYREENGLWQVTKGGDECSSGTMSGDLAGEVRGDVRC